MNTKIHLALNSSGNIFIMVNNSESISIVQVLRGECNTKMSFIFVLNPRFLLSMFNFF